MIKIESNFNEIAIEFKKFGKNMDKAMLSAIDKTAAQGKTFASREVRKEYNIASDAVKKGITLIKTEKVRNYAMIKAQGKALSLGKFISKNITQQSDGVVIEVKKGHKKLLRDKFITHVYSNSGGKHKGVFFRKGPKIEPSKGKYAGTKIKRQQIFERFTLSVADMFRAKRVINDLKVFVADKFPKILEQRIDFYNK